MLSIGLLASTLLLACGGMAFADAGAPMQTSDDVVSSSEEVDRGVNPQTSAQDSVDEYVPLPVPEKNADISDFTGVDWLLNETVSLSSPFSSSVSFSCGGVNYSTLAVASGGVSYDALSVFVSGSGWVSEDYRLIHFPSDVTSSNARNWILANGVEYVPPGPSLGEQIVDIIASGLGVVGALGTALTSGFDAVFVDSGALTSVGLFAFVLLGLGISVGIVKKCFNWITGRHGM